MELELKMPLFCGGRVDLKKEKKEENESLFIIGGGGGAAKTGIPNEIVRSYSHFIIVYLIFC